MQVCEWYYENCEKLISDVEKLCNLRKVTSIKCKIDGCLESHPCCGHDGAVITFENGDIIEYICSTVELGIIMYYYDINDSHFTQYVDTKLRSKLDNIKLRNKSAKTKLSIQNYCPIS
jgi:hypothetical protein